jgi:hypothetical protein
MNTWQDTHQEVFTLATNLAHMSRGRNKFPQRLRSLYFNIKYFEIKQGNETRKGFFCKMVLGREEREARF